MSSVRVWYCPSPKSRHLAAFFVTLPITLPQRQAYGSSEGWQGYGSSFVGCYR
ncbi:hypothetical protein [uncultured Nostoc sp.]|uniref:hypothetical protein n=1 Tax=uncultured Nostoc sp. TaxID=340711 RepID=UPI0035CB0711